MITLDEVLSLNRSTDRLKIVEDNKTLLYIGYRGLFDYEDEEVKAANITPDLEVTKLSYSHELRRRDWKTTGDVIVKKDDAPTMNYADLEERIYLYIRVKAK